MGWLQIANTMLFVCRSVGGCCFGRKIKETSSGRLEKQRSDDDEENCSNS